MNRSVVFQTPEVEGKCDYKGKPKNIFWSEGIVLYHENIGSYKNQYMC